MSEQSSTLLTPTHSRPSWRNTLARRWPVYAGIGAFALLVVAYVDAGEEPLRPITQPVALDGAGQ